MFSVLNSIPHSEITACDISEKMLEKYPKEAKKKIVNLEEDFPFENNSFDLAFCFFTLEHIENIENFFNETYRILSDDGQIFIGHFFQRREFERTANQMNYLQMGIFIPNQLPAFLLLLDIFLAFFLKYHML
jgi:ubiquinone/menaquinone biosynthesis C-methylase UbiE